MITKNMKTVALAASLLTLFAACDKNHVQGSKAGQASAANVKQAQMNELDQTFSQFEGNYNSSDLSLANMITAVGLVVRHENVAQNGSISSAKSTGMTNIMIQYANSTEATPLVSIDDWTQLQTGKIVNLDLSDSASATAGLGGTPAVKARCLNSGCTKIAVLIYSYVSGNGGIAAKTASLAGFIVDGNRISMAQGSIKDLNTTEQTDLVM